MNEIRRHASAKRRNIVCEIQVSVDDEVSSDGFESSEQDLQLDPQVAAPLDLPAAALNPEYAVNDDIHSESGSGAYVVSGRSTDNKYSSSASSSESDKGSICEKLAHWACSHNIPHNVIRELLEILRSNHMDLPKDPRTLLKTPRSENYEIKQLAGGQYHYIGLENSLSSALPQRNLAKLTMSINIDGIPLFRSSSTTLWPILALIDELREFGPFVLALFVGQTKPSSVHEYLSDFIREMRNVLSNGLTVQGKTYQVILHAFICDAPARSFLKGVKGHSGYNSCERCVQTGKYDGRIIYPQCDAPLRTDSSFAAMADSGHHLGESPLIQLNFGMVSQFVLDYQHLVCLGVVRKMVFYWTGAGKLTPFKLRNCAIHQLSDALLSFRRQLPREFCRKPRSIFEAKLWKASEYRFMLLYGGPVCLRGVLSDAMYKNFLLLSACIRCLLHEDLYHFEYEYIEQLMKIFVKDFGRIYGRKSQVYNVHHLIHLVSDARRYGSLENVSCFPFESMLGRMKKLARRPGNPIAQILRRIQEKDCSGVSMRGHIKKTRKKPEVSREHFFGPNPVGCRQFRCYFSTTLSFSLNVGDNCVQINGLVCLVRNILLSESGEFIVVYQSFQRSKSYFTYPFDSTLIGIKEVCQLATDFASTAADNIEYKLVLLHQSEGNYVALPLIHSTEKQH